VTYQGQRGTIANPTYGLTATQTLFNGYLTAGKDTAGGSQFSPRLRTLRTQSKTVLLNAATAY